LQSLMWLTIAHVAKALSVHVHVTSIIAGNYLFPWLASI
jgi:hypothetical protein